MTENETTAKICPFITKPVFDMGEPIVIEAECLGERCAAWQPIWGTIINPEYGCKLIFQE